MQAEVASLVSNDVAEKVELEKKTKETKSLTVEREFMIFELEQRLQTDVGQSKRAKQETVALEGKVKTLAQSEIPADSHRHRKRQEGQRDTAGRGQGPHLQDL